jgi:hypothetical protein
MRGGAWLLLALSVVGVTALPGDKLRRRNGICSAKYTTTPTTTSHSATTVPVHTPCVNRPTDRQCWGDFDINTNYYQNTPDTGVTKEVYSFLVKTHNSIGLLLIMSPWRLMALKRSCWSSIINTPVQQSKPIGGIMSLSTSRIISKITGGY